MRAEGESLASGPVVQGGSFLRGEVEGLLLCGELGENAMGSRSNPHPLHRWNRRLAVVALFI